MSQERMNSQQASSYIQNVKERFQDPAQRQGLSLREALRTDPRYIEAIQVRWETRHSLQEKLTLTDTSVGQSSPIMYVEEFPVDTYIDYPLGNQKAIAWGQKKLTEFDKLTTEAKKEKKKRADLLNFISETGIELLQKPEMLTTTIEYWKIREQENTIIKPQDKLSEKIINVAVSHLRNESTWAEITDKDILEWLKTYTHSNVAAESAGKLLQGYFKAVERLERPKKHDVLLEQRKKRIAALYNFTLATLNVVDDPAVLKKAINIGFFNDDVVLPKLH